MTKLRRPCANCPWRVDAPRNYWDPSHFESIAVNCRDDGLDLMGCHKSTEGALLPCQGWVRVMGFAAVGVRIGVMTGKIAPEEVTDTKGPELFATFTAMLRANAIKIPRRNRRVPMEGDDDE